MKKRLKHLTAQEEEDVLQYIKVNYKRSREAKISKEIYERWGVEYKPSTVKYLLKKANHPDFLIQLQEDNKKMRKWMESLNTKKKVNYADLLNDLANKVIDQEDFNRLEKLTGVEL